MLTLEGITHRYVEGTAVEALAPISFQVSAGEFVCLLGPSGCGKTTLLLIIAGIEEASCGSVTFNGVRKAEGPLTTVVWQGYALFPWRTVRDNILFGPEVRGVSREERYRRAERFIELVQLKGFENHYPHELSGGMKQRVALARALCTDPEVLLMDEPLAALDAQTRALMQIELLRIWSEFGKTVVYVTHSIEEAVLLGDRVAVMTARPGTIKEIIEVKLTRPRSLDMIRSMEFHHLCDHAWKSIQEELSGP